MSTSVNSEAFSYAMRNSNYTSKFVLPDFSLSTPLPHIATWKSFCVSIHLL